MSQLAVGILNKVFDLHSSHVKIRGTLHLTKNLDKLAGRNLLIPYFEFSRLVNQVEQPLTLTFRRNGQTAAFEDALPGERPGIEPTPWLLAKLLRFRPISGEGQMACRW